MTTRHKPIKKKLSLLELRDFLNRVKKKAAIAKKVGATCAKFHINRLAIKWMNISGRPTYKLLSAIWSKILNKKSIHSA